MTSTAAAATANQNAQAWRRPLSRGMTSSRAKSIGKFIPEKYSRNAYARCAGSHSHLAQEPCLLLLELGRCDQALVAQLPELLDLLERILVLLPGFGRRAAEARVHRGGQVRCQARRLLGLARAQSRTGRREVQHRALVAL